jgi:hypothetical protein
MKGWAAMKDSLLSSVWKSLKNFVSAPWGAKKPEEKDDVVSYEDAFGCYKDFYVEIHKLNGFYEDAYGIRPFSPGMSMWLYNYYSIKLQNHFLEQFRMESGKNG